jgi:hypothetical protein
MPLPSGFYPTQKKNISPLAVSTYKDKLLCALNLLSFFFLGGFFKCLLEQVFCIGEGSIISTPF